MIRPIAICVFRHGDRILVIRDRNPHTKEEFFRPFGGGLEFGELAIEAVVREINEELGEAIVNPVLLGVLEERFDFGGTPHHEHLFVFDAQFQNRELYQQDTLIGVESNGNELRGEWLPSNAWEGGPVPLFPTGLRNLLVCASSESSAVSSPT